MLIFCTIVLIFVGVIFSFVGFHIAILHMYNSFINNYDRDKLRYKDPEKHAKIMGWVDLTVGVAMIILGVVNYLLQNEAYGMYFLAGTVVALFMGLIINDNLGLK
ncbi:MAG: hypothetical protein IKB34_01035 [Clostridia bacterium]|nr:hypothetical protein [Clostridia bacterium]